MNPSGLIDLVPSVLRRTWSEQGLYPDQTVHAMFTAQAQRDPDRPAVLSHSGTVSYGQLLEAAHCIAAGLRERGIVAGDVVAYQLPNSWVCCAIDLGVALLGAVVAPFPPGRGRLDMECLLRRCSARAVIVTPAVCPLIEDLRPTQLSLRVLVVEGAPRAGWATLDELLARTPAEPSSLPVVDPNAPVRLLVSSGTESEPKLVAYSHNALLGGRGRFLQRLQRPGAPFRALYLVPLGSSFGSTATFGVLAWLGGSIALLPHFEAAEALAAVARLRPTHVLGVPTMLQRMAADPALALTDTSSLVAVVSGGAVIDPASIGRCVEALRCGFISLYGSADGVNCHNTLDDLPEVVLHTVGKPNPSVCAIRIVDDAGVECAAGTIGEIQARGPISPMQYVNAPELDRRYRTAEGWVCSGDLGYLDAGGHLVLTGRKKDIIIRGGANISTVQIESLATRHPDVVSAACVPVPDADLGQRVCLCLTVREGAARPSLAQMSTYLREQGLEIYKLPEYLRHLRDMPLSPAGKIDKKALTADVAVLGPGLRISR